MGLKSNWRTAGFHQHMHINALPLEFSCHAGSFCGLCASWLGKAVGGLFPLDAHMMPFGTISDSSQGVGFQVISLSMVSRLCF